MIVYNMLVNILNTASVLYREREQARERKVYNNMVCYAMTEQLRNPSKGT